MLRFGLWGMPAGGGTYTVGQAAVACLQPCTCWPSCSQRPAGGIALMHFSALATSASGLKRGFVFATPLLSLPQLVAGGSQLALPLSFRRASPQLLALFLACVWTEVRAGAH